MGRLFGMIALLVGLSACHASGGFGIGDSGQRPVQVASTALQSSVAQASIGTEVPTGD